MAKQTVSVRIEPELLARIEQLAAERRWSVSQWIAVAAERVADGEEAKHQGKAGRR